MIQANELRIGNWVKDAEYLSDNYMVVRMVSSDLDARPIPLTPKILEKAGFRYKNFTHNLNKLSICLPGNSYKDGRTYFNSWCIIEGIPNSLHQLQNLYFALTGTELEIKL